MKKNTLYILVSLVVTLIMLFGALLFARVASANTFPTTLNDWESGDIISEDWANALEDKLGIDSSAVATSIDYLIKNAASILGSIANITPTDSVFVVGDGTVFVGESGATARTSLGLTIGTNVQAWDAFLDDIAALTDPNADKLIGWDDSDGNNVFFGLGTGLSADATPNINVGGLTTAEFATTSISQWNNDSGYNASNDTITLSSEVSGSGTSSIAVTIADDVIGLAELADADLGAFTCSDTSCLLDASTVSTTIILDNTIGLADLADLDFGSFTCDDTSCLLDVGSVSTTVILDDTILAADFADQDLGDLSVATNSFTLDANVVALSELADTDFGAFTCTDTSCLLDTGVASTTVILDDTILVGDVSDGDWGDFTITSNVANLDADVVQDTEIDWGTGAAQVSIADLSGNQISGALVWDFGGASSIEIVNGTGPTVDAAGEIAIDTTADQFIYYGTAKRVISPTSTIAFALDTPAATDYVTMFKAPYALTITDIHCITDPSDSGESVSIEILEGNSTGDSTTTVDAAITCDSDGAEDDGTLTNGAIDAGDWIVLELGTVTGTVSVLSGSVYFTVTAQ